MFLKSLSLTNFLSYGPKECQIPLGNVNIFVGSNGSGKSNLIEAVSLLKSTPTQLTSPVNSGGGVSDWLWKGNLSSIPVAKISAVVQNISEKSPDVNYNISFTSVHERFEIIAENIETCHPFLGENAPFVYYKHDVHNSNTLLSIRELNDSTKTIQKSLRREDVEPTSSILSQRKDSFAYPELTYLGKQFGSIKIYREWSFGMGCLIRQSQTTDSATLHLDEDCRNLAVVINRLRESNSLRKKIQEYVRDIYDGACDVSTRMEGGRALLVMSEDGLDTAIPANRLSDGTLRYLCLMAILLDPNPPPVICIEEPEMGLHPDMIMRVADMIKDASQRTQLIITTHSPRLLSEFTEMPDVVRVCEKQNGITSVRSYPEKQLKEWIDIYGSLGEMWRSGELGGNRW